MEDDVVEEKSLLTAMIDGVAYGVALVILLTIVGFLFLVYQAEYCVDSFFCPRDCPEAPIQFELAVGLSIDAPENASWNLTVHDFDYMWLDWIENESVEGLEMNTSASDSVTLTGVGPLSFELNRTISKESHEEFNYWGHYPQRKPYLNFTLSNDTLDGTGVLEILLKGTPSNDFECEDGGFIITEFTEGEHQLEKNYLLRDCWDLRCGNDQRID